VKKLPKYDDQNIDLPFGVSIQRGIVDNFTGIQKFGYNSAVGTSFETVWDGGGTYVYPSSAGTATITSSNTSADNGGTVQIEGLDSNYDLASEVLTIGGSAGSTNFIRVFRAFMKTANTGTANVGTITVTVSSTTVAQITATYGQTLMSIYTTPRNTRGYLVQFDGGMSKQKEVEFKFMTRDIDNGNVMNVKSFQTSFGAPIRIPYLIPVVIEPKTDIEIQAKADATTAISAGFELLLEDITFSG